MFYYIEGVVSVLEPLLAVLDCNGVGYAINTTTTTISNLRKGEKARLYTCPLLRQDSYDLFGFWSREERRSFEMLIGVSGVGPKAAQSILSAGTPESLSLAIMAGNEKALTVAPGIGKKIAQRVILELRDKISKQAGIPSTIGPSANAISFAEQSGKLNDAAAALSVLGYSNTEIATSLSGADVGGLSVEELIRHALRMMIR